ncbi:hypothetical protein [Actinokineospora iranica]|uniref:Uncharacterized protein n=1 Tax=Actinokineospora iranica TaxID=1271860 RepID=A0A1G6J1I6_9PSEU|nr:hypothetical protein [Actinokineospora iranica]SDC12591.1 hypothetical protein SAMN05216174_101192 [Actinokineospora iranica]
MARTLLDAVAGQETFDVVSAFAMPLSIGEKDRLRLMRADAQVAELAADAGQRAEWAPDGSRFAAIAGEQVVSIDARTGAIAKAACTCYDVAVAARKVYAAAEYGATELKVFDLATLKAHGPLTLHKGASSIAGAGDRLVTFQITETGARDESELIIIEPATGAKTNAGKVGQVADTAFTPRGWWAGRCSPTPPPAHPAR